MWGIRAPYDRFSLESVLFSTNEISSENPFVFRFTQPGSMSVRAISYTDNAENVRYHAAGWSNIYEGFFINLNELYNPILPPSYDMWRLSSEWLVDDVGEGFLSGVLLRFYEIDRDYFYRVTRDGFDLGYQNSLWLDGDSENTGIYRLVPSVPLNNFRWLTTMWWHWNDDEGAFRDDYTEEFSAESISRENPFVFRHGQAGSFAFRGISFTDSSGTTRYFRAGSCMLFGGFRIVNEHFMRETE